MDLYRQQIIDHYKHPHNFGHLKHSDHSLTLFNSVCGDKITMEMKFSSDHKTIESVKFSGVGCAISQASASLLTDSIHHQSVDKVLSLTTDTVLHLLNTSLTPSRIKCALLPLEVIQKCILEWKKDTVV
jgi:nitrogen fixation NifU-like protein